MESWRGKYNTELEAYRYLENEFGGSLINAIKAYLGESHHPSKIDRGDIGVLMFEGREICAVKDVGFWWVPGAVNGLRFITDEQATPLAIWRVI
jgi:hypothetical protein